MSTDTSGDESGTATDPETSETQERDPHTCQTCGVVFDRAVIWCCPICKRVQERGRS